MNNRKLILYISCSLDGFIAKPNDDLGFLSIVEKEGEDYGYNEFIEKVDTVIIGRRTYEWVVRQGYEFPYADKEAYIITRQKHGNRGNMKFYNGDLETLIKELKSKKGKTIFCDGGSQIVNQLLYKKLFNEMIISIIPILIGDGIELSKKGIPEHMLQLLSVKNYNSGLVQLHYKMKKPNSTNDSILIHTQDENNS